MPIRWSVSYVFIAIILAPTAGIRAEDPVPPGLVRMSNGRLRPMTAQEHQAEARRKATEKLQATQARRTPAEQAALAERRQQEQKDTARIREDYEAIRNAQRAARRPIAEAQRLAALSAAGELFAMGISRARANHAATMSGAFQIIGQQGAASQFDANRAQSQALYNHQQSQFQAHSFDRAQYLSEQKQNQLAYVGQLNAVFADFKRPLEDLKALETAAPTGGASSLGGNASLSESQLGASSVPPTVKPPDDRGLEDEVEDMRDRIDNLRKSLKQRKAALEIMLNGVSSEFRDAMLIELTKAWGPAVRVAEEFLGRPFEAPEAGGRLQLEAAQNAFVMEALEAVTQQVERSRAILRARKAPAVVPPAAP